VLRTLKLVRSFDQPFNNDRLAKLGPGRFNRRLTTHELTRNRPDAVMVWSQLRLTLGPALAAQDLGIPTVFTMNDEHPIGYTSGAMGWSPGAMAGWVLDRMQIAGLSLDLLDLSHTICVSKSLKRRLIEAGVPVEGADVVYQGIPTGFFPQKEDPGSIHEPVRVLYVGQIHPYKGVHTLVEAFVRLHEIEGGRWRLTIVGEGPDDYVKDLRVSAESTGGACAFNGKATYAELPAIYRDHDIFVFPSTSVEAFGLTQLEAMCSGLPVVATSEGGHGEVLVDGDNALIFPQGDADALAKRLKRLSDDEPLRRSLARNGALMVRNRFDTVRYFDDVEAFLEKTLRDSRS
ncbi:MAG: glycosyltransferase family 4 protein, partial [Deltaproteobacteria bacterium]|nr:glycosyltransferase family 4 protein [Deltaproteobacteria bacterium]